jgi:hypothetical protein
MVAIREDLLLNRLPPPPPLFNHHLLLLVNPWKPILRQPPSPGLRILILIVREILKTRERRSVCESSNVLNANDKFKSVVMNKLAGMPNDRPNKNVCDESK